MLVCLRRCFHCLYPSKPSPASKSVQPRISGLNNSTHISSVLHRSLKGEYPNISVASVTGTMYEENRVQTLPVASIRPKLDEKHFSSLMLKRKNKDLICPEGMDKYREVGGVLMLGKQLRQPVQDTF